MYLCLRAPCAQQLDALRMEKHPAPTAVNFPVQARAARSVLPVLPKGTVLTRMLLFLAPAPARSFRARSAPPTRSHPVRYPLFQARASHLRQVGVARLPPRCARADESVFLTDRSSARQCSITGGLSLACVGNHFAEAVPFAVGRRIASSVPTGRAT